MLRFSIAMLVGVIAYFVALFINVGYTGAEMLICQPFMAIGISFLTIVIALILSLPIYLLQERIPYLRSSIPYFGLFVIGFILYIIPLNNTPRNLYMDMNIAEVLFMFGYFLMIYSIVTWPVNLQK